jgi:hypothetical protein
VNWNVNEVMRKQIAIGALLTIIALGGRLSLAVYLPNDDDDDGRYYAQIAKNLLDHHGYSGEAEEPYPPTYIRVPGYPIFLASVYGLFGRDNNLAVRIAQAVVDTICCWLIAFLAAAWSPRGWDRARRWRAALAALGLAAVCPFIAIYVTTILTESWATTLSAAFALPATLALKAGNDTKRRTLWLLAGLTGGAATMFRPDCAIFVCGAGLVLVIDGLRYGWLARRKRVAATSFAELIRALVCGLLLAIGFSAALAPWTIRNARVFGVFQPVAPPHANMPDEFAPLGYIAWLRTWVDDERYVSPIEDGLDLYPINIELIPDSAFDSPDERTRVAGLIERYNNPPREDAGDSVDDDAGDETDEPLLPTMTPELDAEFAEIARSRVERSPVRYYFALRLKRAASLWFDTHSQFYPFQGELFPWWALDRDKHQQYWLPLFAVLTWIYTVLGLAGVWVLKKNGESLRWLVLIVLLVVPRFAFLAAQEHPEGRYTVEFLPFIIAAGGLALAAVNRRRRRAAERSVVS